MNRSFWCSRKGFLAKAKATTWGEMRWGTCKHLILGAFGDCHPTRKGLRTQNILAWMSRLRLASLLGSSSPRPLSRTVCIQVTFRDGIDTSKGRSWGVDEMMSSASHESTSTIIAIPFLCSASLHYPRVYYITSIIYIQHALLLSIYILTRYKEYTNIMADQSKQGPSQVNGQLKVRPSPLPFCYGPSW